MADVSDDDDDITVLTMEQVDNVNFNIELKNADSCPESLFTLKTALDNLKENYKRVEERNFQYQQMQNKLVAELNEMKQIKNKWVKELIEKDVTCGQLRQKVSVLSQDIAKLHECMSDLKLENSMLRENLTKVEKENKDIKLFMTKHSKSADSIGSSSVSDNLNNSNSSPMKSILDDNGKSESWQELSQKLLKQMKQEMVDLDDQYAKMMTVKGGDDVVSSQTGDEHYHSHHKLPDAPCACVLAPCTAAVDSETNVDAMVDDFSEIRNELASQTESLRNTWIVLKNMIGEKSRCVETDVERRLSESSEYENKFISNVATFNSETKNFDISLQPSENIDLTLSNGLPYVDEAAAKNDNRVACDDRVCPMCEAVFPNVIAFADFETHVLSHFDSDGDELVNNFEFL